MSTFNTASDQGATQEPQAQGTSFENTAQADQPNTQVNEGEEQLTPEQVQALVKRDAHAQGHIEKLERETAQYKTDMETLRAKSESALTAEELLEKLNNDSSSQIDMDALVKAAAQTVTSDLESKRADEANRANFSSVADALQSKYGEKADEHAKKVASDNGMSFDDLLSMAHTNPTLVKNLCQISSTAPAVASVTDGVNTQGYNAPQEPVNRPNVMNLRTSRAQVDDYHARLDAYLAQNPA